MRFKQKTALLLASAMLVGSIGIMNTTEVRAKEPAANTFTLTVPADTSITQSGWNSIGDVKVDGDIDASKRVTVEISTINGSKLISEDRVEVPYSIKKNKSDESATKSIVFYAPAVNNSKATSTIGADVEDYNGKAEGTYTDTINFTATLEEITVVKDGNGDKLSLGQLDDTPKSFSVGEGQDEKCYVAYNDFISKTAYSSWQNAQDFVAALNAAEYEGHKDWQLLDSPEMATAWYKKFSGGNRGTVQWLWSPVEGGNGAYFLNLIGGAWGSNGKSTKHNGCGFVVLRGSSEPLG